MSRQVTCFLVDRKDEQIHKGLTEQSFADLPDGEVLIEVEYSAVNYKDGLASSGHPGVALTMPLVPGIDAVGQVIESSSDRCSIGDEVMVTGAAFGTSAWGGWSTHARVPGDYCIPIPSGMTGREAAILGTAGFTAAQSFEKLLHNNVQPEDGPVLVSGATGGVGIFAVRLLSQFGYHVVAATGKSERIDWLKQNGATEVIDRGELIDDGKRPLLSGKWAGAIDTVGGEPLANILRSSRPGACITACGLVAGHKLQMTVYPFILRGVTLQGIDSANASVAFREHLWKRLATDLKVENLEALVTEVPLAGVEESANLILGGKIAGRHLVKTR